MPISIENKMAMIETATIDSDSLGFFGGSLFAVLNADGELLSGLINDVAVLEVIG